MVWRNRPYSSLTNLTPGPYTHSVTANPDGTFDHTFTGTQPLGPFQGFTDIRADPPNPRGQDGCADVEHFINGTTDPGGDPGDGTTTPGTATFTNAAVIPAEPTEALTINKVTTSDDPSTNLAGSFDFTVVCDDGSTTNVTITTDATGNGTVTNPDLPLYFEGTSCTVTETVPPGWTLTSANDVVVQLGAAPAPTGTPANGAVVSDNCQNLSLIHI